MGIERPVQKGRGVSRLSNLPPPAGVFHRVCPRSRVNTEPIRLVIKVFPHSGLHPKGKRETREWDRIEKRW